MIYYFFAIIGMEMFGDKGVFQGCCNTSWYGVGQYYAGPQASQQDVNSPPNGTADATPQPSGGNFYYLNNFQNILRSYGMLVLL